MSTNHASYNVFRVLGDLCHVSSKLLLIWAIHSNRSAEGVSLLTQLLYIVVFVSRYLDLFWMPPWWSWWNFVFKIFYLASSFYIVFLMMRVFARTREKEGAWKLAASTFAASLLSAPIVCLIAYSWHHTTFVEVLYTFSLELESICVLPQLLLLRQTSVPTVLDSYYLVTLGSYRFFYLINWIVRGATEHVFSPVSAICGAIQTLLYLDFAWVYYSRQRVKLRGGGVVDADDLSKGFIVRRLIGTQQHEPEGEVGFGDNAAPDGQKGGTARYSAPTLSKSWGAKGISVSADDTLPERLENGAAGVVDPPHCEDDGENADVHLSAATDDQFEDYQELADNAVGSSTDEWSGERNSRKS